MKVYVKFSIVDINNDIHLLECEEEFKEVFCTSEKTLKSLYKCALYQSKLNEKQVKSHTIAFIKVVE